MYTCRSHITFCICNDAIYLSYVMFSSFLLLFFFFFLTVVFEINGSEYLHISINVLKEMIFVSQFLTN